MNKHNKEMEEHLCIFVAWGRWESNNSLLKMYRFKSVVAVGLVAVFLGVPSMETTG